MPLFIRQFIGVTGAPGANFNTSGINSDNEVANPVVGAAYGGGVVCTINVHFGGNGATVTARNAIWDSSGNIIAKSAQFTAPAVPALQTQHAPAVCLSNLTFQIGFWRAPGGSGKWFVTSSGTFNFKTDVSGDIGSFSGPTACAPAFICDNIQAYALLVGPACQPLYFLNEIAYRKSRYRRRT